MMRKNKFTAIVLAVLLIAILTSVSAAAAGTAAFVKTDRTTGGDWVGNYGSEGYIIANEDGSTQSIPSYAKLEFVNESDDGPPLFYVWWDSEVEDEDADPDRQEKVEERKPGTLFKSPEKTHRIASCYYSLELFNVTIDVGSETKVVTMYMLDYDGNDIRQGEITAYDENGKELAPTVEVYEYSNMGCYTSFKISGKVRFEFYNATGNWNVVLEGIFFDPDPDAAAATEPATEPEPTESEGAAEIPEAPKTGDAGVCIFAVLALTGIAGFVITKNMRKKTNYI